LVKGASQGEGLGNKFLSHIREVDAIVQVLRYFKDSDVVHVHGTIDPLRDVEIINTELILADLEVIERNLPNISKRAKTANNKDDAKLAEILSTIKQALEQGKIAHNIQAVLTPEQWKLVKPYNLLCTKPIVYAINISQEDIAYGFKIQEEFMTILQAPVAIVSAKLESEMMDMHTDEKQAFVTELLEVDKLTHLPTLDDLISLAFDKVGLMYYFTTGEKETKARTVKVNSTAPQAAGAIHTDFQKGFIKAEVVSYQHLVSAGSRNKAKEK